MDIQWLKGLDRVEMSELMLTRWRGIWGRACYSISGWLMLLRELGLWRGSDDDICSVDGYIGGSGGSGLVSGWVDVGCRWFEWYKGRSLAERVDVGVGGISDENGIDVQGVVRGGDYGDK